ncbi:MAG: restriction endonuclease subunit S [Caldilineaceae bacterium]|nr:restriction endonuclease subunit S [Caldilineaceae bacterium]
MLAPRCGDGKKAGQTVLLGDCIVINDSTYSPKEAWPFVNYLDTGNITENRISEIQIIFSGKEKLPSRARRKVRAGDIVYSTVRPNQRHFGLVKEIPHNFLASTGFAVIRGKDNKANTDFIYWFLAQDHIVDHLQSIAEQNTSAYPSIKPSDIQSLELDLPPLPEQRAIAHILGTLDDKIELNRRMNETLEGMARALFKCWFVDFEPVRAKMEGRWGKGESLPGMPAELYGLFPDGMVDSELGEVPAGWGVKVLGDVIELAYGKALKADNRRSGTIPVYGSNGQVGWHDEKLVAGPGIVVGRKGNPGVVTWAHGDFFPIDTTFYVVQKTTNWGLPFLFFALNTQDLPAISADSAVPGLNRNLAYMNRQVVPNGLLVDEFNGCAGAIFRSCHHLEEESNTLAALRDALLPKLISGKLQVTQRRRRQQG